jgi:hypothetical protein
VVGAAWSGAAKPGLTGPEPPGLGLTGPELSGPEPEAAKGAYLQSRSRAKILIKVLVG